ncbi:MAG TPA: CorA family divalent cation transporter [Candidatus Paceibacterota bacterium]|jgi:magnesium transporter|nr:CorA family divalent cation transporter [Candidatus Paceibacterota bacterium]
MRSRFEHGGLIWIDLESPTREEVRETAEEFQIEPLVAEELLLPSSKPRAEFHTNYAYVVMRFPALHHSHKTQEQEIDFVIGRNFLVTARYDMVDPLHKFSKVFEVNSVLDESNIGEHAGFIFFYMLRKLYRSIEHEVEYVQHDLHIIEEHIFSGKEISMVAAISRSARDLLNLRQTIEPHREILHELEADGPSFFGPDFAKFLRALSNEYYRVHNHIMRYTEFLHELRETNNSLLTTKQNETMKRFTILAFTIFPLELVAAIFSMRTTSDPIVGLPYDWWIIVGGMSIAVFIMYWYYKRQEWL